MKCLLKSLVTVVVVLSVAMVVLCGLTPALKIAADAARGWGKREDGPACPDLRLNLSKLIQHSFFVSKKLFVILNSFYDHLIILYCRAVDSVPSGGLNCAISNTVTPVCSASIYQILYALEYLQIVKMPNKGEELMKEGKVLKRVMDNGKSNYICNMEAACVQESDTLAGITRHVTCSHIKTEAKPKLGADSKKRTLSEMASPAHPGTPGKERKLEEDSEDISADMTTISEIERIGATLEETLFTNEEGEMDTPTRPFSQTNDLIVNSTQVPQFNMNMEVDLGDATYVPEVPSPDKTFRKTSEPSEVEYLKLFEASKYFYGEGSPSLTQGMVEEPSPEESEANLRLNHPFLYEEDNLESGAAVMICSVCGSDAPIHSHYGSHIMEHLDIFDYMPGLWKNGGPSCRTAPINAQTTKRELSYMVHELRQEVDKYETYFLDAEDCRSGRKTAATEMDKKIQRLNTSIEKLRSESTQATHERHTDEKSSLQSAITDLQHRVQELEVEKISMQASMTKERKSHLSQLQRAAEAKKASKAAANSIAQNAEKQIEEAESLKAEYNALRAKCSTAEFKLQSYGLKMTQMEVQVNQANEEKNQAGLLYEEAKNTIAQMLEGKAGEANQQVNQQQGWQQNAEGLFVFPKLDEFDGTSSEKGKRGGKNTNSSSQTGAPKDQIERCMYHDRPKGCNNDSCEYAHPDNICPDYLNRKCEKPRFSCTQGHHNKKKRDEMNSKKNSEKKKGKPGSGKNNQSKSGTGQNKQKSGASNTKEDAQSNTVAVGICPNWIMGMCLASVPGQQRCRAGAHVPSMQGRGAIRVAENLTNGPGVRAAPAVPSFTPSYPPGMGGNRF